MTEHKRETGSRSPGTADPLFAELRRATLGDYEVLAELGRGGMAAVYLAHDLALDRKVAIKVMFPEMFAAAGGVERFQREARTAASLTHPHIVPIYAVREHERLFYFVMQFVAGRTLDSVIEDEGQLPIGMVQTIMSEVGGALGYAHRNGVIHRDVKPANVLLDEEGRALVADFGIAKVTQADNLTRTGGIVGTPTYMSPEQSTAGELTGASDQYSLGVVAYELLTGRVPFAGGTSWQVMQQHCMEEPPPIVESRPDCPTQLAEAVLRMMAKAPQDRWPTLEAAVTAIGSAPQSEHRAIRTQMGTLAATGGTRAVLDQLRTPSSPVPPAKPLGHRSGGESGSGAGAGESQSMRASTPWLIAVPSIIAVVAVVLVAWLSITRLSQDVSPDGRLAQDRSVTAAGSGSAENAVAFIRHDAIPPLIAGRSHALRATPFDSAGRALDTEVQWTSLDPDIARVTDGNRLMAVSPGITPLLARGGNFSLQLSVEVLPSAAPTNVGATTRQRPEPTPPTVARLDVTPTAATLTVGDARRLQATPRDRDGSPLSGLNVSWRSEQPDVADVTADGLVTARAVGTARITVLSEGVSSIAQVTVVPVEISRIDIRPSDRESVAVGGTVRLSAAMSDARGEVLSNGAVSWVSSNPAVASVSPSTGSSADVTGRSPGTAFISATSLDQSARAARAAVVVFEPRPVIQRDLESDRNAIRAVLSRFDRAFRSRDLNALTASYPNMSPFQRSDFEQMFRVPGIVLNTRSQITDLGDDAASATLVLVFDVNGSVTESTYSVQLVRRDGAWLIDSMTPQ